MALATPLFRRSGQEELPCDNMTMEGGRPHTSAASTGGQAPATVGLFVDKGPSQRRPPVRSCAPWTGQFNRGGA